MVAISVFPIPQVITKPLDRCDRDPIQFVLSKYRQNVFVEPRSKIEYVRGAAIGLAPIPVLGNLRKGWNLGRFDISPCAALCAVSVKKRSACLRVLKRNPAPRAGHSQRPIVQRPKAFAIAAGTGRHVELINRCQSGFTSRST